MKKENIALGIFLVFIVGAGVYFYCSQTVPQNITETNPPVVHREPQKVVNTNPSDMVVTIPQAKVSTEGWKTCRNEEYGYEFKYPAEWHINSVGGTGKCISSGISVTNEKWTNPDSYIVEGSGPHGFFGPIEVITTMRIGDVLQTSTSLADYIDRTKVAGQTLIVIGKGKIGGEDAMWEKKDGPKTVVAILIFHNKNLYRIEAENGYRELPKSSRDINETILSTFKFIK